MPGQPAIMPSAAVRPRGRPRGGELVADRDQIIAAALRAVRANGPSVTMAQIAAEATVTKPIIYRVVGDKQAVAEALAEYLSLEIEKMTAEIIDAYSNPRERFAAAARAFFELLSAERELYLFVAYGWGSRDGNQLEAMIERSARPLIEEFATTNADRAHPPSTGRVWAYATVGALQTVSLMWIREPFCSIDELVAQMTDYVVGRKGDPEPT